MAGGFARRGELGGSLRGDELEDEYSSVYARIGAIPRLAKRDWHSFVLLQHRGNSHRNPRNPLCPVSAYERISWSTSNSLDQSPKEK